MTDSADYAKKTDIPTTLPANGGNADTVNNHNVESDVPVDAVFTDTIYDDTKIKYGEIAGGKNLLKITREDENGWSYSDKCHYNGTYTMSSNNPEVSTAYIVDDWHYLPYTFTCDGTYDFAFQTSMSIASKCIQLEEGTQATDYEPYIPSVKMLTEEVGKQNESLSVIGKCKNLLNPTLATTTMNGIECTNNGDGTYTLNGTVATGNYEQFTLLSNKISAGTYKLVGNPDYSLGCSLYFLDHGGKEIDYGNGGIVNFASDITTTNLYLYIPSGVTLTNVVFKPMLTTNLNATYDDFVPYTGDGDTLTHDVAEIKNDLSKKNNYYSIEANKTITIKRKEPYTPIMIIVADSSQTSNENGLYIWGVWGFSTIINGNGITVTKGDDNVTLKIENGRITMTGILLVSDQILEVIS